MISLSNVIYKIITNVIAKHLKPILPFIISKDKVGYVKVRKIMDIVILVHKFIHSLETTKTPRMLIKLNISKSFDRISW